MPARLRRFGLRTILLGSYAVGLLVILGILYVLVPMQTDRFVLERLEDRAERLAEQISRNLPNEPGTAQTHFREVARDHLRGDTEVVWAALLDASSFSELAREPVGVEVGDGAVLDSLRPPRQMRARASDVSAVGARFPPEASAPTHYVVVAVTHRHIETMLTDLRNIVLVAMLGGFLVLFGLVLALSRVFILRPLHSMLSMASKLSDADLTGRVDSEGSDELATLSEALNRIGQSLRDTLSRIRGVADGLGQVIDQISRTGNAVSSGSSTVLSRVEETSFSMQQMMASLRGIAENVEVLYQSAEESASSILEMAATNDEVAENVQAMAASVEETTGAIERMTFSIKEVAKNVEQLLESTEETSSSINEMDVSIGQVEMNANETAKLSEQVSKDAEMGVEALQKTLAGIDKIKESSRTASAVIVTLEKRVFEIGNILNVIDDVAEQTNLLALNAAIIAAQAGEHGKGFAVVADEIKDLAERTGVSTKEIAELIRNVQSESQNAVAAMNQGVRNVEEGVELGRAAENALKKIFESANKSTTMVKAIARATVEQARGSRQVTEAVQRIAETVQQISHATSEQARGSEQIIKSAERMKLITTHVQRSSQEQAHGSKQITRSIESINEMVTHLNRAQKEQTKGTGQMLEAVEAIKTVSEHQSRSVRQLEEAIEALQQQADVLKSEVRRFRV